MHRCIHVIGTARLRISGVNLSGLHYPLYSLSVVLSTIVDEPCARQQQGATLRSIFIRTWLHSKTNLRSKLSNKTQWIWAYRILEWHVKLRSLVFNIADESLEAFVLSLLAKCRIGVLVEKLCELNSVITKLQSYICAMRRVRACYDYVLEVYPTFEASFGVGACAVQDPICEWGS